MSYHTKIDQKLKDLRLAIATNDPNAVKIAIADEFQALCEEYLNHARP